MSKYCKLNDNDDFGVDVDIIRASNLDNRNNLTLYEELKQQEQQRQLRNSKVHSNNKAEICGNSNGSASSSDSFEIFFDIGLNQNNSNSKQQQEYNKHNKHSRIFEADAAASRAGGQRVGHNMSDFIDLEGEQQTMEVPLLNDNNNISSHNNNNDYDHCYAGSSSPLSSAASTPNGHSFALSITNSPCRCGQSGFSADLTNKSTQEAKLKILLAITLCCIFMIIEFLGGYIAGSLAIMTDAAHLASDCISFVIGLVAIWLGSKPPDHKMSFGYKRMEVLGAIMSIVGIWTLTATLVIMAVQRIFTHDYDLDVNTMMTISGIGILINIAMMFILHGSSFLPAGHGHGHSHSHSPGHGHFHTRARPDIHMLRDSNSSSSSITDMEGSTCKSGNSNSPSPAPPNGFVQYDAEKNLNLRAAMIHVIGDLVQSVGVFLAAVLIKVFPSASVVDPLCTLVFSVIVVLTTVRLFKESVTVLMDAVPPSVNLMHLEMDLMQIEGVKSVQFLNVWSHTANHHVMMAHLTIDCLSDSQQVLQAATQLAHNSKYRIKHSTIQIERLAS